MAGHSKWANIKHRKGKADVQKGKIFSRLVKEIISAVKQGGPDQKSNTKLRLVIQKARAANLPSENIERNIKKASSADQADYAEMTYELYGHGGVGIIAEVMTDNKNRISSDMRIATNKKGGTVATPGSVTFNFDRKGVVQVARAGVSEDELFLLASEAGADDFAVEDELFLITTAPEELFAMKELLESKGIVCVEASIVWLPKLSIECDEATAALNRDLMGYLEGLDDIDVVYHNMQEI